LTVFLILTFKLNLRAFNKIFLASFFYLRLSSEGYDYLKSLNSTNELKAGKNKARQLTSETEKEKGIDSPPV